MGTTMTYFKSGTWNVICAVCGGEYKSDEILKRWDGLLVCKDDFEVRHVADFIRPITEHSSVPFSNPEPADVFVVVPYRTSAIAGIAVAGIAISGKIYNL